MKLNYGCVIKGEKSVSREEILSYEQRGQAAKEVLKNKSRDMLGWLDLPYTDENDIERVRLFAKKVNEKFLHFVVFGIGGSALGAIAVNNALGKYKKSNTKVHVIDNVDPEEMSELFNSIDITKTMFNVVTKSGSTVETLMQLSVTIEKLKENNCNISEHIVVTTENGNSLYEFAKQNNIEHFSLPKDVGGRFSVLSNVGLLPIAVMGVDLVSLLRGARNMLEKSLANGIEDNSPLMSAAINCILMDKGIDEIVVMPYSYKLKTMSDFYLQLLGESLAKEVKLDGNKSEQTLTPIRAVGVTDQHSQIQLYMEGKNNKVFFFISQNEFDNDILVPPLDVASFNDNRPQTVGNLLLTELNATMFALNEKGRPSYLITLERVDEYAIGELIMYFELVTAFMGEFMNINAYNQPGVELGKINTKALLNNEKYKSEKEKLLLVKTECDKFIINS